MKILKFKCKLLSDIILNVKSASEGNNQTLDFIPGNNFLGIVAAQLYSQVTADEALDLFHNSTVRYGDAHPAAGKENKFRTLRVPAAMYYPKPEGESKAEATPYFISYLHEFKADGKNMQPKQCRDGFYAFEPGKDIAPKAGTPKAFALKSAYDRTMRRAKDEQLFGYESLQEGMEFYFSVETDKDDYAKKIEDALTGIRRLGRSRGAQYGLVRIEPCEFSEVQSDTTKSGNIITVYADGRLIFLDDYGQPTFQLTAERLGVEGGKIDWEKSQIRTFQYAPWNGQRHTYDTDRMGIEKGSVFVVSGGTVPNPQAAVGSYRNEGFGRVIYNAHFLEPKPNTNGLALYSLGKEEEPGRANTPSVSPDSTDSKLLVYLRRKATDQQTMSEIYKEVNEFVNDNESRFKSAKFASQWGTIRSIAMAAKDKREMRTELLTKTRPEWDAKKGKNVEKPIAYLTHGTAKEKWDERGRRDVFKKFFKKLFDKYDDYYMKQAIVNLASQMGKKSNKGKEGAQ